MNDIELRWKDAEYPIPTGFVGLLRKALKSAYEEADLTPPKGIIDNGKSKAKGKRKVEPKSKTRKFEKGDELDLNGKPMVYDGKTWKPKPDPPAKKERVIRRRKKAAEKPKPEKRVIRRRKKAAPEKATKKPSRKIKRRKAVTAEELNRFGMKPNLPPAAIVEALDGDGASFSGLVEMLINNFGLHERRAKAKIKGIVNKLARRKGAEVVIVLAENEGDDYYSFLDAWYGKS
jgi:hypothetical protein